MMNHNNINVKQSHGRCCCCGSATSVHKVLYCPLSLFHSVSDNFQIRIIDASPLSRLHHLQMNGLAIVSLGGTHVSVPW